MSSYTPTYNLKAVTHETGLSPATLRAWERRYGLLKPQRSPGGHRLYSAQDIEMLKWLVRRQAEGLSISHAVEMWRGLKEHSPEQLQEIYTLFPDNGTGNVMLEAQRSHWIAACLVFDENTAEQALAQAFAIATPEVVCTEILQKGLAEIGGRWYTGSVSVQQEHFASALAMRRINSLFAAAAMPTRPGRILAACPPGEQHDFALLMLAFLLRRRGWDVVYLGANVPLSRLDATIRMISPRLILSVVQTLNSAASLQEMANYAHAHQVALAYGGGIFKRIPTLSERISGCFLGNDLTAAPRVIEDLLSQPPPLPTALSVSPRYIQLLEKFSAKEALIVTSVTEAMQSAQLEPAYQEEAISNFSHLTVSALKLGDITFLDHSVGWLKGLLENYGLSPSLAVQYYKAYHRSVQQHLGNQAEVILNWFSKFGLDSTA